MSDVRCVVDNGALLGECPLWDDEQQLLYWVDIDGKAIHRYNPSTAANETRLLPSRPGSIALTDNPGQLLVATEHELGFYHWSSDSYRSWSSLESAGTGNRLNDGRCDPSGRFIVGSMWAEVSDGKSTGILHQVDASGKSTTLRADIGVSNGIAFDAERRRMYFADSPTGTIWVYDYDLSSGEISNQRTFFRYDNVAGAPDGGCVDAEGFYWSASVFGWALTRIAPDGTVDQQIELPVQTPTMPAFGGPNLSTLFVTTLSYGQATDGFVVGSPLAIETDTTGILDCRFDRSARS